MRKITITDKNGLHARPASEIVAASSKHAGDVSISKAGSKVNAKSILKIMSLGIVQGDTIEVTVEGQGNEELENTIEQIILNSN
jgi:phosphotransferase system HPr (HPr) family protein